MAAPVALIEMAAESGGAAALDRSHDAALRDRKRSAVLLDDSRHRSGGTHPPLRISGAPSARRSEVLGCSGLRLSGYRPGKQIERAGSGAHFLVAMRR